MRRVPPSQKIIKMALPIDRCEGLKALRYECRRTLCPGWMIVLLTRAVGEVSMSITMGPAPVCVLPCCERRE